MKLFLIIFFCFKTLKTKNISIAPPPTSQRSILNMPLVRDIFNKLLIEISVFEIWTNYLIIFKAHIFIQGAAFWNYCFKLLICVFSTNRKNSLCFFNDIAGF